MEKITPLDTFSRAFISHHDVLDRGLLLTKEDVNRRSEVEVIRFELFTAAITSWLIVIQYLFCVLFLVC